MPPVAVAHVQVDAVVVGAQIEERAALLVAHRDHRALRVGLEAEAPLLAGAVVEEVVGPLRVDHPVGVGLQGRVEAPDLRVAPALDVAFRQVEWAGKVARLEDPLAPLDQPASVEVRLVGTAEAPPVVESLQIAGGKRAGPELAEDTRVGQPDPHRRASEVVRAVPVDIHGSDVAQLPAVEAEAEVGELERKPGADGAEQGLNLALPSPYRGAGGHAEREDQRNAEGDTGPIAVPVAAHGGLPRLTGGETLQLGRPP